MKKLIAFDLDGTLAVSKSAMGEEMCEVLRRLLEKYEVCIISGGKYEQFKTQVVDRLNAPESLLSRLHLMPTCGTRYYRYNETTNDFEIQYAENLTDDQKKRVIEALESSAKELGYWCDDPAGDIIEDRESQITFSAIGQLAKPDDKYKWDPSGEKKMKLRDMAAAKVPDLEFNVGGTTSVDVTKPGIDKAYGMKKIMDILGLDMSEILFIGDKLQPGGNDYPARAMGLDWIEVRNQEDTEYVLRGILAVS